jgi:hypothetical protein
MYIQPVKQVRPDLTDEQCDRVAREIDLRYDYTLGLDMAQIRQDVAFELFGPEKEASHGIA